MVTRTEAREFSRDLAHAIVADTDASAALRNLAVRDPSGQLLATQMISDIRMAVEGARGTRLFPRVVQVALRHLSSEGLPRLGVGLSAFDWGGLVGGLITGAAAYSAAKLGAKTQETIAKIQASTQLQQQTAEAQAQQLAIQAGQAPPAITGSSPRLPGYPPPSEGLPWWIWPMVAGGAAIGYFVFMRKPATRRRR